MTIAPAERVETSMEEIAALDFEPEVPCEAYRPCHRQPHWWVVVLCCSAHTPACDECRARYVNAARVASALGYVLRCSACGSAIDPLLSVRFEPIK